VNGLKRGKQACTVDSIPSKGRNYKLLYSLGAFHFLASKVRGVGTRGRCGGRWGALCLSLMGVQKPPPGQAQGPRIHVPALLPVPRTGCCPYALRKPLRVKTLAVVLIASIVISAIIHKLWVLIAGERYF